MEAHVARRSQPLWRKSIHRAQKPTKPSQAIWIVNMANVLFWFIMKPTDERDPVKTIITSMAAVLTTSMSLRIILSVRGSLDFGGSFALSASSNTASSRTTHVISGRSGGHPTNISTHTPHGTYTLDELRTKPGPDIDEWTGSGDRDTKSSVHEGKTDLGPTNESQKPEGLKITIDREVEGYQPDTYARTK